MRDFLDIFQPIMYLRVNGVDSDDILASAMECKIKGATKGGYSAEITLTLLENGGPYALSAKGVSTDDARIQPGATWEIRWGYRSNVIPKLSKTLRLAVTHYKPSYPETGDPKLILYLSGKNVRINRDSRAKNWGRIETYKIAQQIAERYGMDLDAEQSFDARRQGFTQPADIGDFEFLQKLAARIRFVCYVDGNTLHYHRPDMESAPTHELNYMRGDPVGTLLNFEPEVKEMPRQRTNAQGDSADEPTGSNRAAEQGEQNHLGVRLMVHWTTMATWAEREQTPIAVSEATPETEPEVQRRIAQARQRGVLERAVKARATVIGDPTLRIDTNVTIRGVDKYLDGVWHVREEEHTLSSDGRYTTTLDLRRGGSLSDAMGNNSATETPGNTQEAPTQQSATPLALYVERRGRRTWGGRAPQEEPAT